MESREFTCLKIKGENRTLFLSKYIFLDILSYAWSLNHSRKLSLLSKSISKFYQEENIKLLIERKFILDRSGFKVNLYAAYNPKILQDIKSLDVINSKYYNKIESFYLHVNFMAKFDKMKYLIELKHETIDKRSEIL